MLAREVRRELTHDERAAVLTAFSAAAEQFSDAAGTTEAGAAQSARSLVALHAHHLGIHEDGTPVLLIEYPANWGVRELTAFERQDKTRGYPTNVADWRGCNSLEELRQKRHLDVELRPHALPEAITILLGSENPEAECRHRRAQRDAESAAATAERDAQQATERAVVEAKEKYERENATRLRHWRKLSRRQQQLYVFAEKMPEFGAFARALADLERPERTDRILDEVPMPAAFEREDIPWWERDSLTPKATDNNPKEA